jgi:hypothetical protein
MNAKLTLTFFAISFAAPLPLEAAEITAQRSEHGAVVKVDGEFFTEYLVRSGTKPILWPIVGPTGKAMTRGYPMETGTSKTNDHVHQRSFWFTHGNVNGIDFWAETPAGQTGKIVHRKFVEIESGLQAKIVTENDWISPRGAKVLEDQRRLAFGADESARWIDFAITLRASEGAVRFGDTKEGSFGLRIADSLRVESKPAGRIVNSRGQTNGTAWGKLAEWVDCQGPVAGEIVGIAIFNHPSSFRYPTGWHVRTYGLFAANPFAQRAFAGNEGEATSYELPKGREIRIGYRVYLHCGDEKQGKVAEAFAAYAKLKK